MTVPSFQLPGRTIDAEHPTYIIAELSANHNQDQSKAEELIRAAKAAGADAVKLQTYTADTLTIDSDQEPFQIKSGTLWDGQNLHQLYQQAFTPWEWQPRLFELARELGLDCFSSPFDATAVDFLETLDCPCYKVASFELVDTPLLQKIGETGKPVIMSTGMATLTEIEDAVKALRAAGTKELALLKCTSSYPSVPEDMNLKTISHLAEAFRVLVGLSDHTLGIAVPVVAVTLGARIVEKHFTLSRADKGPDSDFSLEPHEFREMLDAVRIAENAVGQVRYQPTEREQASRIFRRSLFVVQDIAAGENFTAENVRSIRPGHGMPPKYLPIILGKTAKHDLSRGTPLSWDDVR